MTRTLLTALFVTLFTQTAWAKNVYYCNGSHFTEFKGGKLENYKPENFKFSVDQKRLIFGAKGFFDELELKIVNWSKKDSWQASNDVTIVTFNEGQFVSATSGTDLKGVIGILIAADCDEF